MLIKLQEKRSDVCVTDCILKMRISFYHLRQQVGSDVRCLLRRKVRATACFNSNKAMKITTHMETSGRYFSVLRLYYNMYHTSYNDDENCDCMSHHNT
jgi:hypothetical protein